MKITAEEKKIVGDAAFSVVTDVSGMPFQNVDPNTLGKEKLKEISAAN